MANRPAHQWHIESVGRAPVDRYISARLAVDWAAVRGAL